jgi:hypothetical protein
MQVEAVFAQRQHDLTRADVFGRATFDLNHVTRPKTGQHTFPANAQTQMTTST